jgi:hypothetical protein
MKRFIEICGVYDLPFWIFITIGALIYFCMTWGYL